MSVSGRKNYTAAEDLTLRRLWADMKKTEIAALLGRTIKSVGQRAHVLNICERYHSWTAAEIALFRDIWETATPAELRVAFPWATQTSLRNQAQYQRRKGWTGMRPEGWPREKTAALPKPVRLPLGEAMAAALAREDAYAAISAAVPRGLPYDIRQDLMGDMLLAFYAGELALADIAGATKGFLSAHDKASGRWKTVSLDAPIPGTDGLHYIDRLADGSLSL